MEQMVISFPVCIVIATASMVVWSLILVYCKALCIRSAAPLLLMPPRWGLLSSLNCLLGCHWESPRRVSWRQAIDIFSS